MQTMPDRPLLRLAVAVCSAILVAELIAMLWPNVALALHGAILMGCAVGVTVAASVTDRAVGIMAAGAMVTLTRLASAIARSSEWSTLTAAALGGSIALLACVLLAQQFELPIKRLLRITSFSTAVVAAGVGVVLGRMIFETVVALDGSAADFVSPTSSASIVVFGVVVSFLCVGLLDEIVYRGFLQTALKPIFGDRAILISAVLFGAGVAGWVNPVVGLLYVIVGLVFGWLRDLTGSILPGAIAHGCLAASVVLLWPSVV